MARARWGETEWVVDEKKIVLDLVKSVKVRWALRSVHTWQMETWIEDNMPVMLIAKDFDLY